ncbi:MAG: phosphatase PAP2 family protein [Bacteroidetes bacterium]|nr:phosphatase PAP2 family protein [Bacteroidota bacterium]
MKQTISYLFLFFITWSSFAQDSSQYKSVYKFRLSVDIPIGLITAGTGIAALVKYRKHKVLTPADLNSLQASDVNKFDRYAIYQHSKAAAITSDVFQYSAMVSPAFLFIDKKIRKDWNKVLPVWVETFALTSTLTMFAKEMMQRKRPYVYNPDYVGTKFNKKATSSFFSGHTSITAASTYFIAMVYADYHPQSRWKPLVWTSAAIFPVLTGLLRVKAGKHYWTDVITGYAVGALVGTLTPLLHRREFRQ